MPQRVSTNTRDTKQNETWQERQKWRGIERRQMQWVMELAYKGQSTIYLQLANTREVGPRSKVSEGAVWWWGKTGLFWGSYRGSFHEKCFARMTFLPKEGSKGVGTPNACHRGRQRERERASNPCPLGKAGKVKGINKNK